MKTPGWLAIVGCGVLAAVLAVPFGALAQGAVALLGFLVAFIGLIVGIRKWKPRHRSPWYFMTACAGLFFALGVTRAIAPTDEATSLTGFSVVNGGYVLAYLAAIASLQQLGRLRNHDKDPTNLIDALILACGIGVASFGLVVAPMLGNPELSTSMKATNSVFGLLDLAMFFFLARLAIGPGSRAPSARYLAVVPVTLLVRDQLITLEQAGVVLPGITELSMLMTPIAGCAVAAIAMHPSMLRITEVANVGVPAMTRQRMTYMIGAVLVSPLVMFVDPDSYYRWVVPSMLVTIGLITVRLGGLVRVREHMTRLDAIVADGSRHLVAATRSDQMQNAAIGTALDIATTAALRTRVSLLLPTEDSSYFVVTNAVGEQSASILDQRRQVVATSTTQPSRFGSDLHPANADYVQELLIPLFAGNSNRGYLVIESDGELPGTTVDALCQLTTQFALSLEASDLRSSLNQQASDRRFKSLVENSSDILLVIESSGNITFTSPQADVLLDWAGNRSNLLSILDPTDTTAFMALISQGHGYAGAPRSIECRIRSTDGNVRWFEATATDRRADPDVSGIVVNAHDITLRKTLEDDLRHRVLHDDLTGIPNRVLLRERADHAISIQARTQRPVAALFIDIDDFKTINDGLGHSVGDELLKIIAFRLNSFVRDHDTTARLGGDEFAVLLQSLDSPEEASLVAERLLHVINEPVDFNGRPIQVSASIGVAIAEPGHDSSVLLRNADVAMYEAKRSGKGCLATFNQSMYDMAIDRLDMRADLLTALEKSELELYYQPIIGLDTGILKGFEALLRWIHPVRGFVSPAAFIPVAEETGLIVEIGRWVLETATQQLATWRAEHPRTDITMNINLAPRQLAEDDIVQCVTGLIAKHQLQPEWLILELTESESLDSPVNRERLAALAALGVGIAADDFGSGFASYAALQVLPFTVVKIDRSLLSGLDNNFNRALAQLRSIVEMSHSSGLTVVAEGIETVRQRDIITALGCDKGQGFLFGRPVPADAAAEFINSDRSQSNWITT